MKQIVRYKDLWLWPVLLYVLSLVFTRLVLDGYVLFFNGAVRTLTIGADTDQRLRLIGAMIAVLPAAFWATRRNSRAKARFLTAFPDGNVSPAKGYAFCLGKTGLLEIAVLLLLPLLLWLIDRYLLPEITLSMLSHFAVLVFGVPVGLALSTVWMLLLLLLGVWRAQAKWKIELFL